MGNNIKYMDIAEFRDKGFLQEANRQFFHPLGLALEIVLDKHGKSKLGGIWDYRDDPEGNFFANDALDLDKTNYVFNLKKSKQTQRFLKARDYGLKVNMRGEQQRVE